MWAVMAAGAGGVAVAWRFVASGRAGIFTAMACVLGPAGAASLLLGGVALSPKVAPLGAAGAGIGSGLAFFGATLVFVRIASAWPPFARSVARLYDQRGTLPLWVALITGALVVVTGEELFWRGLVQTRFVRSDGATGGAILAWVSYVAANAAGGSLAAIAAAAVGGAVWGSLALWTGGLLASVLCHMVWTALMIARPPAVGASA